MSSRLVTFTLDVEDHRPSDGAWPERFTRRTLEVLDLLDELGVRGSVYFVGELAEANPGLVREAAARGHEIGLHAWRHVQLTRLEPAVFAEETRRGKAVLEQLVGAEVTGFRAPTYSLVRSTVWAVDICTELGFRYSSSTLPGRNPLFGFPGLPTVPFRWHTGLVEFPGPIVSGGPLPALAFLGGTYLRLLPWPLVAMGLSRLADDAVAHTYCHPYDFDPEEPYWVVGDVPRWMNRLLWARRRGMRRKVTRLLAGRGGPPLGELVDGVTRTFDPTTAAA